MKALSRKSAWSETAVVEFLETFKGPVRIAATTEFGFPLICSLWYQHWEGTLLCATQRRAALAQHLARDGRCAFELSTNEPPYFGLRGRGVASISSEGAPEILEQVASRYLGEEDSPFRQWLRNRAEDEVCIRIEPAWMTTWDYRNRMTAPS